MLVLRPVTALTVVASVPTVATAAWLFLNPDRHPWLGVSLAAVTGLGAVICLLYGSLAAWASLTKVRTPLYETLPRETTGPVLVIPLATTVSTSMLTVGVAVGTLTFGDAPAVASELRSYMALLSVVGLAVGLIAPWAAVQFIRLEREGADVAIFDLNTPPQLVLTALQRRWDHLYHEKRVWYGRLRSEGLGSLTADPEASWPSGPYRRSATRPMALIVAFLVVIGLSAAFIGADAVASSTLTEGLAIAAIVVVPGAVTGLALVLVAFTLAAQEQRNAGLLRRAHLSATERLETQRSETCDGAADAAADVDESASLAQFGALELAVRSRIEQMSRAELLMYAAARHRPWR